MKGIIFNLLEMFITEKWGENEYEKILEKSALITTEPFVGPGSYPDKDILEIIQKSCEAYNVPLDKFLNEWGVFCVSVLAEKFSTFFEQAKSAKEFLLSVESIHYTEVVKLYKNAIPPHFTYKTLSEDSLIMSYQSPRKLCHFMNGLIEGVGYYYKTSIQVKELQCMLNEGEYCEFELTFPKQ